jgi:hypothetical protein
MRHPTKAAIDRLSKCFGLTLDPYMQDWEIECADPKRVGEFLDFYLTGTVDDDERFTLMALILGSFEEYYRSNESDSTLWDRIKSLLSADVDLHSDHIEYYQRLDALSDDECFPISKLMRQIEIPRKPEQSDPPNCSERNSSR